MADQKPNAKECVYMDFEFKNDSAMSGLKHKKRVGIVGSGNSAHSDGVAFVTGSSSHHVCP